MQRAPFLAILILLLTGSVAGADWSERERATLRDLWIGSLPELSPADFPTNPVAFHPGAPALGQQLFPDTSLSHDGKSSCSSCHLSSRAMAGDRIIRIPGQGPRKPPSILGAAWQS